MEFTGQWALSQHIKIHKNNKCTICQKCFGSKRTLKTHFRTHPENVPIHSCMDCGGKEFKSAASLKRHQLQNHTSSLPFQCPTCLRKFTRKESLQLHMNLHNGKPKPIKCSKCDKGIPYGFPVDSAYAGPYWGRPPSLVHLWS